MQALAIWILPIALILLVFLFVRLQSSTAIALAIVIILFAPLGGFALNIQPSFLQLALYLVLSFSALGAYVRFRPRW